MIFIRTDMENNYNILQFRYATPLDILLMLIGTAGGMAHGVIMPLMILVFGSLLNSFTDRSVNLCSMNYTALALEYCPEGYHLTASNYYTSLS